MSDMFWISYGPALFGLLAGLASVTAVTIYVRAFDRKYGRDRGNPAE